QLISQDFLPHTRNLWALEENKEMDEFKGVLDDIKRGEIHLGSKNVKLADVRKRNGEEEVIPYTFRFLGRSHPWMEKLSSFPRVLWLNGDASDSIQSKIGHDKLEDISDELRSLERPWDGIDELAKHYLGLDLNLRDRAVLRVMAPVPMRFGKKGTLSKGNLRFSIEMADVVEMKEINVSAITYPQTGFIDRRVVDIGEPTVNRMGSMNTVEIVGALKNASYAKLFLSYSGTFVDSLELYSPAVEAENPRFRSYEVFDKELGILQKQLLGEGSAQSEDFEKGVATLLHLLGLSVIRLTGPIEREIDILATIPEEYAILAAECTLGNVKHKSGTVRTRANKVADAVSGYHVIPSVWTTLSGTEIPRTESEGAAKDKVALITSEHIKELFQNVKTGRIPENMVKYFSSLVPSSIF
ncbi:MAG: hypothetical protein KAW09_04690, partial [Thermoplasmata archaeon]|nr:hypothetical protein [Thermoplasmata archaeon]